MTRNVRQQQVEQATRFLGQCDMGKLVSIASAAVGRLIEVDEVRLNDGVDGDGEYLYWVSCGDDISGDDSHHQCEPSHLSPALRKAIYDPYSYLVRLRSGQVFQFSEVEYSPACPEWITLKGGGSHIDTPLDGRPGIAVEVCGRGVDIRVSDVECVIDCES